MRDYKESVPRGQKRSQLKRLFGIMGGMIFAFAIFIAGVKVGIQLERERLRISQEANSPMATTKDKESTGKSEADKSSPAPGKQDERMRFTFYETLTKKQGTEEGTQKKETQAKKEQEKVTEKKGETKAPPPKTAKVEEPKKTAVAKELYFVQISSFREKEGAEGMKGRYTKKGYPVQVVPVQIQGMGLWYRVKLGGYATLQEAQAAQKRISVEENIEGTKVESGP
jgi:cell division protein FtsN